MAPLIAVSSHRYLRHPPPASEWGFYEILPTRGTRKIRKRTAKEPEKQPSSNIRRSALDVVSFDIHLVAFSPSHAGFLTGSPLFLCSDVCHRYWPGSLAGLVPSLFFQGSPFASCFARVVGFIVCVLFLFQARGMRWINSVLQFASLSGNGTLARNRSIVLFLLSVNEITKNSIGRRKQKQFPSFLDSLLFSLLFSFSFTSRSVRLIGWTGAYG